MRPCNEHLRRVLELVDRMVQLADAGDLAREDVGCGVLYGVVRDAAFKIKQLAERERETHIRKGWWAPESVGSCDATERTGRAESMPLVKRRGGRHRSER